MMPATLRSPSGDGTNHAGIVQVLELPAARLTVEFLGGRHIHGHQFVPVEYPVFLIVCVPLVLFSSVAYGTPRLSGAFVVASRGHLLQLAAENTDSET